MTDLPTYKFQWTPKYYTKLWDAFYGFVGDNDGLGRSIFISWKWNWVFQHDVEDNDNIQNNITAVYTRKRYIHRLLGIQNIYMKEVADNILTKVVKESLTSFLYFRFKLEINKLWFIQLNIIPLIELFIDRIFDICCDCIWWFRKFFNLIE